MLFLLSRSMNSDRRNRNTFFVFLEKTDKSPNTVKGPRHVTASGAEFRPYSVAVRKLDNLEAGERIEVCKIPGRMPGPTVPGFVRKHAACQILRSPDGTRLYWFAPCRTTRETLVDTFLITIA